MDPLEFPHIPFDHSIVEDLFEIERVRVDLRTERILDPLTLELRKLFQSLTSMMSARIEGNRTTVADVIAESRQASSQGRRAHDAVQEILQLEDATRHIDELAERGELLLTHRLVRDLHRLAVEGLDREGDRTPGSYRRVPVEIAGAQHRPPDPSSVHPDMDQLLEFARHEARPQLQLVQIALVHHRFVWIHPFVNGNGRVSRLLTYAMLVKMGYTSSSSARPVNPTAVFGADRQAYYDRLAQADSLSPPDLFDWCAYVIHGLRRDLSAVTQLADRDFVVDEVLAPALHMAVGRSAMRQIDARVLTETARRGTCRAGDLETVLPGSASSRSQRLRRLVESGHLQILERPRRYAVDLRQNDLMVHIVRRLDELEMLPAILRD